MSEISDIMKRVVDGSITQEEASKMIQEIVELEKKKKEITYKVSEKGAISFYGIRRMPITLYKEELIKIVNVYNTDDFQSFLNELN
jgi:hypothetical protein